jgi:hypothetical protein
LAQRVDREGVAVAWGERVAPTQAFEHLLDRPAVPIGAVGHQPRQEGRQRLQPALVGRATAARNRRAPLAADFESHVAPSGVERLVVQPGRGLRLHDERAEE